MRFVVGVLACIGVGGISLALADPSTTTSAPSAPSAPAAPSAPTAAAATPAPATPAPAKPQAAPAKTPEIDQLEKQFLAEGYKMEMLHGEKVFCRREDVLGSRLGAQKVCSTAQQLAATEQQAKASVDRSMMQQNNPTGR